VCNDDSGAPLRAIAHGSSRPTARRHARGGFAACAADRDPRVDRLQVGGAVGVARRRRRAVQAGRTIERGWVRGSASSASTSTSAPDIGFQHRGLAAKSRRGVTASGYRCPSVSRCWVTKSLSGCARRPARAWHHAVSAAAPPRINANLSAKVATPAAASHGAGARRTSRRAKVRYGAIGRHRSWRHTLRSRRVHRSPTESRRPRRRHCAESGRRPASHRRPSLSKQGSSALPAQRGHPAEVVSGFHRRS
jgi:hypothetical protein